MTDRALVMPFSGEAALVTGAASGIGRACLRTLAGAGLRVVGVDLGPGLDEAVAEVGGTALAADVTDEPALADGLAAIDPQGLAYVVNCAGIHRDATFDGLSLDDFRRMLDVNTLGAYAVTRAAAPWLRRTGHGSVVNITSLEAHRLVALMNPEAVPHYATSKAALASLTQSMAHTLARDSIRVNAVAPGFVATPMTETAHGGGLAPQAVAHLMLKRYATPEEIAGVVAFLLSDLASYITATTVMVDGGFHAL